MKATFLNQNRPLVCGMVLNDNPNDVKYRVKNSIYAGRTLWEYNFARLSENIIMKKVIKRYFPLAPVGLYTLRIIVYVKTRGFPTKSV